MCTESPFSGALLVPRCLFGSSSCNDVCALGNKANCFWIMISTVLSEGVNVTRHAVDSRPTLHTEEWQRMWDKVYSNLTSGIFYYIFIIIIIITSILLFFLINYTNIEHRHENLVACILKKSTHSVNQISLCNKVRKVWLHVGWTCDSNENWEICI